MAKPTILEQEQLEHLRLQIISRIEDLMDQQAYGMITDEEMHRRLSMEFGEDWMRTVGDTNKLLYHYDHGDIHVPHSSIMFLVVLGVGIVFGFGFFFTSDISAAIVLDRTTENHLLAVDLHLAQGQQKIISLADVESIQPTVSYDGADIYTLFISDAAGKRVLAHGNNENMQCVSCKKSATAPFSLGIEGEGILHITEIAYSQKTGWT